MKIEPLCLSLVRHPATKHPLYPHQAVVLDEWESMPSVLLVTKTGTGKTMAAVLPVLLAVKRNDPRWKWAVAVYPTNELIQDQARAIEKMAQREELRPRLLTPDEEPSPAERARTDLFLVPVDARILDGWQRKWRLRQRSEALRRLLEADKPRIVLTNPDILFLILALRYHADPLAALQAYKILIFDEFHLYQGMELAHALFMTHLARQFGIFEKILLLSATPAPEVGELLEKILTPRTVCLTTSSEHPVVGDRTAVHEVEVIPVLSGGDMVETAFQQIRAIRDELRNRRRLNPSPEYLPGVVILNSVVNIIWLEDRLIKEGIFIPEELLIIRGLSSREIRRRTPEKVLAIGTSAIEVGIDFHTDWLVFEASDAPSFLQRFGRIGRHGLGKAIVLCPSSVLAGMEGLPGEINRGTFEEKIYQWYPRSQVHPWFVRTEGGLITIRAQANGILRQVQEDPKATPGMVDRVREKLEAILESYVTLLDCKAIYRRVRRYFEKAEQGDRVWKWLATYETLNTFRTSLPSIPVFDWDEFSRRGNDYDKARYEADLKTLLHRGTGLQWNEELYCPDGKRGILTVKGYGRYKRVWLGELFSDEDRGCILETSDPKYQNLLIYQEGQPTPVSDVMQRQPHIFTVVPKADVEAEVDWRMPVFEAGKYLIAFDGAALLLSEVWKSRSRTRRG